MTSERKLVIEHKIVYTHIQVLQFGDTHTHE